MRFFCVSLTLIALIALTTLPAGAGSAQDSRVPEPWLEPGDVAPTPCQFKRDLIGDWTVQDEKDKMHCVGTTWLFSTRSDETYSNAMLRGAEIWGYSWSWDSAWIIAAGDSAASYDLAGPHMSWIRYSTEPEAGCHSTYEVWYAAQWEWEIGAGTGHAELEVRGVMSAQFLDQVLSDPAAVGGVSRFYGDRATGQLSGAGSVSLGGINVPFDSVTSADADVPPDGDIVRAAGEHKSPIRFTGDLLTLSSYVKVRSYVDEPGVLNEGDVECWVHAADPGLRVRFVCTGEDHCSEATESRYSR